ncbi:Putative membrane protein [Corynebacterium glyciniphilum AJ 3170]|uniref:Putative membrane protein n=2 Tax=Corynebacterium TaxID=1716 RepID=X5EFN1_9CORY|nr:DUF2613 domain-containing protein [Corynebacterium glyciniphilum]AHW65401.1 Putative membrane protein [Corynebacterium glyciniphilum AJ 3170]
MPTETDSQPRRTLGPAIASAVVGIVLGGAAALFAGSIADSTDLPTNQIAVDDAVMGSIQYGERR